MAKKKIGAIQIGKAYLFRTVTHYHVGRVKEILPDCYVLTDAAWVADTGRFNAALLSKKFSEVEPFPDGCILFRGGLIDATPWDGELPLKVL